MKIKGLKKAVGEYNRANAGGSYSPRYGRMMFNTETGELWTDEFYDLGRGSFASYPSTVINVVSKMCEYAQRPIEVTMQSVKDFLQRNYPQFKD